MSLKDQTIQAAQEWMDRTNPECPNCKEKGKWEFGGVELLQKHDLKTNVTYISHIVAVSCACGHEMEHYEENI